ncbi:MAG: hypothetical protein AB4040_08305 [Synechococcus sp.]
MTAHKTVIYRDFKHSLFTWLILEGLCFAAMPLVKVYPFEFVQVWFLPSLVLGPIGALILAYSAKVVLVARNIPDSSKRTIRFWWARFLGVIGFLGVVFPLVVMLIAFVSVFREFGGTL